jgi:hypothetical protein
MIENNGFAHLGSSTCEGCFLTKLIFLPAFLPMDAGEGEIAFVSKHLSQT